jgi:hypothetical protein
MQEAYSEFNKGALPLRQELSSKQAELDALYYKNIPENDPKVQSLMKDINGLDAKLSAAYDKLRADMDRKGIPYGPGMGMGRGYWHGRGGYGPEYGGHGRGHGGYGSSYGGGCWW